MAVDIQRVVLAAVEAALGDDKPEKSNGLSAGKAVAVGAVLVTACRIAAKPGGRFVKEKLRDRLSDGSESDENHECYEDDAYNEAEAEFDTGEEPAADFDEREEPGVDEDPEPEAEADQEPGEDQEPEPERDPGPEGEAKEDEEPQAEQGQRAAAEASEEDERDPDEDPDGGAEPDDAGSKLDDEGPDEPEAEDDADVEDELGARPSKTRPRPAIFDRPGANGSKIRPAARPPLAKKKRTSRLKNRSQPGRPRHPHTPIGRT